MSIRTEWSEATYENPVVVAEYEDVYGSTLSEGNVALVLGIDSAYVIEAPNTYELRELAERIIAACERFDEKEMGK